MWVLENQTKSVFYDVKSHVYVEHNSNAIVTVSTLVLNWKYIYNKLQNMFFNKMFEIFAFF